MPMVGGGARGDEWERVDVRQMAVGPQRLNRINARVMKWKLASKLLQKARF